jgi:hypothetical protein
MAVKIVRLADLIETGRGATRDQATYAAPISANGHSSSRHAEKPADVRTTASLVNGIELLAIELLSLTKTRRDNPRALMIDALRSIDSCLVSIAGKG